MTLTELGPATTGDNDPKSKQNTLAHVSPGSASSRFSIVSLIYLWSIQRVTL